MKFETGFFLMQLDRFLGEGDVVVDLGSGTGIFTSFCAARSKSTVAIEYNEKLFSLSKKIIKKDLLDKIQFVNKKSFDVQLDVSPSILITETIGQTGLEENIHVSTFDFVSRHPSILKVIPSRIKIFVEPVFCDNIEKWKTDIFTGFLSVDKDLLDFNLIVRDIELSLASSIVTYHACSVESLGKAQLVGDISLGYECPMELKINCAPFLGNANMANRPNSLHVFFEASISESDVLSTHFDKPLTHWGHSFMPLPNSAHNLTDFYLKYCSLQRAWFWEF
jgi:hypothetical protein